jgi:hypothetical protein
MFGAPSPIAGMASSGLIDGSGLLGPLARQSGENGKVM